MTGGRPFHLGGNGLVGRCLRAHPATLSSASGRRPSGGPTASACGGYRTGAHNELVAEESGTKCVKCRRILTPGGRARERRAAVLRPPHRTAYGSPAGSFPARSVRAQSDTAERPSARGATRRRVRRRRRRCGGTVRARRPARLRQRPGPPLVEVGAAHGAHHRGRRGRGGARPRLHTLQRHVRTPRRGLPPGREQAGDPFTEPTAKSSSTAPEAPPARAPQSANVTRGVDGSAPASTAAHARCVDHRYGGGGCRTG